MLRCAAFKCVHEGLQSRGFSLRHHTRAIKKRVLSSAWLCAARGCTTLLPVRGIGNPLQSKYAQPLSLADQYAGQEQATNDLVAGKLVQRLVWLLRSAHSRAKHRKCAEAWGGARQVDARLDRRRKGVYGPPQGTRAVVFLDDLSMPLPEQYGAQARAPSPCMQALLHVLVHQCLRPPGHAAARSVWRSGATEFKKLWCV